MSGAEKQVSVKRLEALERDLRSIHRQAVQRAEGLRREGKYSDYERGKAYGYDVGANNVAVVIEEAKEAAK